MSTISKHVAITAVAHVAEKFTHASRKNANEKVGDYKKTLTKDINAYTGYSAATKKALDNAVNTVLPDKEDNRKMGEVFGDLGQAQEQAGGAGGL